MSLTFLQFISFLFKQSEVCYYTVHCAPNKCLQKSLVKEFEILFKI